MNEDRKNIASVGALVGKLKGGKIVNCHAEGTIINNGSATNVGGLVGEMDGGEIEDSTSNMRIISTEDKVFSDLRSILEQFDKPHLIELVNDMESSVGKTTFLEKYTNFISSAADHITVITPFLSILNDIVKVR